MIGYLRSNKIKVNKIKNDNQGRILIVELWMLILMKKHLF